MDYDNPEVEERWCDERRRELSAYLAAEGVSHGQVGEWPAWHLAPHVSIWAIESLASPGRIGWWAICGDLPTDYVSAAASVRHPRDALLAFATRWRDAAHLMAQGQSSPDFSIGPASQWPQLAPMLASRAGLLQDMAANPGLWDEP